MKTIWIIAISSLVLLAGCDKQAAPFINNAETDRNLIPAGVHISEILADPKQGGVEFVEIYNNTTRIIDLSSFYLASTNSSGKLSKRHPIAAANTFIYPAHYKVLSKNSTVLQSHYPYRNTLTFLTMPTFPTLTNTQGSVLLFQDEVLVDSIFYSVDMHDIFIRNPKGVSLERVSFQYDGNDPDNLVSASTTSGYATPGFENSQGESPENAQETIQLASPSFSPAYEEQLEIEFDFKHGNKMATIVIYDKNGRQVKSLIKNHRIGTRDRIYWNGLDNKDKPVPIGLYFIHVHLYHSAGTILNYKESFTVR